MSKMKDKMKTRVIVVSAPQRAFDAQRFARHFKDAFKPYYVFSGEYYGNGQGLRYPMYEVVRLAGRDEPPVENHERFIERKELLTAIAEYRVKEMRGAI